MGIFGGKNNAGGDVEPKERGAFGRWWDRSAGMVANCAMIASPLTMGIGYMAFGSIAAIGWPIYAILAGIVTTAVVSRTHAMKIGQQKMTDNQNTFLAQIDSASKGQGYTPMQPMTGKAQEEAKAAMLANKEREVAAKAVGDSREAELRAIANPSGARPRAMAGAGVGK